MSANKPPNTRTCAAEKCGKPMPTGDNSTACPACWRRFDANLGDIPAIMTELDTTLSRQTASGSSNGPRSSETPLPYNVDASDAARLLSMTLWPWVREGLDAHPGVPLPSPSVVSMAAALMHLHGWLVVHPEGYLAIDEVGYAVSQARTAIDRAADRVYAGTCDGDDGECGEELYAVEGSTSLRCPVCSTERDVYIWRRNRLEAAGDSLLTLSEMTRAIGETGTETVSRKRLEGWVRRGRLIRAGNLGAVPLYRVGDVLDVIEGERRRSG